MAAPAKSPVWLVGSDGSEASRHALTWAADKAGARSASLRLLTAWHYPNLGPWPALAGGVPALSVDMLDAIEKENTELARGLEARFGVDIDVWTVPGPPGEALLETVPDTDLAIVGSRGLGGFARLLLGSVSHQLACHSPRPTLIVPAAASATGPVSRIVVGVDGSDHSVDAMRWAASFADVGTDLACLASFEIPPLGLDYIDIPALEKTFNETVDATIDEVEKETGVTFERLYLEGHAGRRLVDQVDADDILVVGSRGHSGLTAFLMGSTATWVTHHPRSVTVVVPGNEREEASS